MLSRRVGLRLIGSSFLAAACLSPASGAEKGRKLEFNRDIRPILSESCFVCHGPDKNNRKAKLRLDVREIALEKKAIQPGKPEESEMIRRIFETKEDDAAAGFAETADA